ncbi:hypothetical protein LOAG_11011 [Loa loa]|uniref:Bromo domain-containing protein n=1 Tax=Loa loa TaxID=7209 RepID=A0A1S0TNV1_LOALO|nr:hypothetical protein LOAG_11011 [Loa loa]EFO17488.2 hypothetical protein LOAG_11011 [Loa loa]
MKYPSVSLSWKHEETLQLFELMETEDDWLVCAKKLAENFGDERPAGFFTEKLCKDEFERVMSSGHPEHFLRKPGEKYSRKELIHAWAVYLKKELKIKKAQEEELLLVKLRQKAGLFNRLFSSDSDLTDKEIEKLLEEAREEDSARDQEIVRKEIEIGTKNLKEYLNLHETNPIKYPQLKIIIPPSHPLQTSANEAPFSPIKPLFEGLTFEPQITSQTKTPPVANTTSGSPLSRKVSSPQHQTAPLEMLANETLDSAERLSSTQGRLRTLSVSSRTQVSVENNALSCQAELAENSENFTSQSLSSELILKSPSKISVDEIQTAASETPDEVKLPYVTIKNELEEGFSPVMEEVVEKKETMKTRRAQKIVTRSSGGSNNMDGEITSPVQHEHSLRNRRFSVASTISQKNTKISGFISKEDKSVAEEEEDEGKLRRSERCHTKTNVETSASAVPVQTGRRKRAAKLEILDNNEEEAKATPAKRRRLSSRDVENAERKDIKYRIESNIELQSSPEPEKEVQEKHVVEGESDDDKKLVDLRTRSRTLKVAVATSEKAKEKAGPSSEISSIRSPKRNTVVTRSSRRQTRRGGSTDGDIEQKALMVTAWRMVSSHRHAAIFAHPVSDRDARGYSKIVKSRMDLSTLKKQLDGGSLSGMNDFKRNVLLMFANAVMFNSTGHDVNHYAKEMAADTLSSLKMLQKDVLFVRGITHMTRRTAAFAAEEAKFERSRFSSPRVTPVNSEEPGKEKTSDNASRETSETPKPRGGRTSKE